MTLKNAPAFFRSLKSLRDDVLDKDLQKDIKKTGRNLRKAVSDEVKSVLPPQHKKKASVTQWKNRNDKTVVSRSVLVTPKPTSRYTFQSGYIPDSGLKGKQGGYFFLSWMLFGTKRSGRQYIRPLWQGSKTPAEVALRKVSRQDVNRIFQTIRQRLRNASSR